MRTNKNFAHFTGPFKLQVNSEKYVNTHDTNKLPVTNYEESLNVCGLPTND
jgi:hypothetical protein